MQDSVFMNQILRPCETPAQFMTALGISTYMQGILASADQAALLAALGYAEATYTPTVTASSGTFTTVSATGRSVRVKKLIVFEAQIVVTSLGTASGLIQFTLPFSAVAGFPVTAFNQSTGASFAGQTFSPTAAQGAVLPAGGVIAANTYLVGGSYESST